MPSFDIAHIHREGQDLVIFPLDERFGRKSAEEQSRTLEALQLRAHAAGLRGGRLRCGKIPLADTIEARSRGSIS